MSDLSLSQKCFLKLIWALKAEIWGCLTTPSAPAQNHHCCQPPPSRGGGCTKKFADFSLAVPFLNDAATRVDQLCSAYNRLQLPCDSLSKHGSRTVAVASQSCRSCNRCIREVGERWRDTCGQEIKVGPEKSRNRRHTIYANFKHNQWLSCKKDVGEGSTSIPFSFFPPLLHFRPLPGRETAPENQLGGLGRCKLPPSPCSGPQTHFGVFWARKLHLTATFLVIKLSLKWCILKQFKNVLRKSKQLYQKEVPQNGVVVHSGS